MKELNDEIKSSNYIDGDLSDLGNDIGRIVSKYLSDKIGFDKDDFIAGYKHGISNSDKRIIKIKQILRAAGKLAEASKEVIHSSSWNLSQKIQHMSEALEEYDRLIWEYER
jgi:hypothetical protein